MKVLGINAFHGDSSAALLDNGRLVAAIEEERINRKKHWAGLPRLAAAACLAGCDTGSVEHVAVSRNPRANFWRKALRVAARPGIWVSAAGRARNSLRIGGVADRLCESIPQIAPGARLHLVEHHRAHLASAFYSSPFYDAAVVSADGFGDFSSVMWGAGRGNRLAVRGATRFPHSLGIFYTAFTQFLGFPKYGDEYKMMGLAAYGEPRFADRIARIVRTRDADCLLDLDYFTHHTKGVDMTWEAGEPVLGSVFSHRMVREFGPPRETGSEILARHADLAASVQAVLEENYFALLRHVARETLATRLCLAGGVALNCAANGKLYEQTPFQEIYIQPAAHDAGTSIGAAQYVWHQIFRKPREFAMRHVYYGPSHDSAEIRTALNEADANFQELPEDELVRRTAETIATGKIVGWFQGRMEFGPRALGNRSILADPRRANMKDILNRRIKYREPFRPFCPSILAERVGDYFETGKPSPFMVMAYPIKAAKRDSVPAITHKDGTGRLQTVEREANPLYWKLIREFERITGVPILLNTSFNENEPIVATPGQALECFLRTEMDALAIGPYLLLKSENEATKSGRRACAELEHA